MALDATGAPARAETLIRQALAIRENPDYRSNLGLVLSHLGRHTEAIAEYRMAIAKRPGYPEALNNLGVSLEALRRSTEAESAYRAAIG